MAELRVKVKVDRKDLDTFQKELKTLSNSPIQLKVTGLEDLRKVAQDLATYAQNVGKVAKADTDAAKANARYNESIAKYNNSIAKRQHAENELKLAIEKTTQATENRVGKEATAHARIVAEEQKTQREYLKSERAINNMATAWQKLFSAFSLSNIISSGISKAISSLRSYFNEAIQEMKELDLAATHYQQVMGSESTPEQTAALQKSAYAVGSKYGTSASQYMESVATYARAGYKDVADQLAELSMKTVIVGQTTQEVADQFLLTMDTAYKYGGSVEKLSRVLDGASKIDSNYATTIEKIATGLGLVAPLAQQVHTSEGELTAAIGTITAATQRSGAEAARALRSLFLNIIGDTTTEIEDGVTATEESVASVQYLLEKYAKSAVDAARATGEVVDPMEAIGALAQSMKDGLLTESQLMELLSGIGGKLRISQLVALVSNWDMYNNMLHDYEDSIGSADEKTTIYLDSWEAKVNILKNTWTEFIAKTIDSNAIKKFLDFGADAIRIVDNLGDGLKVIGGIIGTVTLGKMASGFTGMATRLTESANALENLGEVDLASAAKSKASMATRVSSVLGWAGIAVGAITTVISAITAYERAQVQQSLKEADRLDEEAEKQRQLASNVEEVYTVYYNAKKAYEDGKASVDVYREAVKQLNEALGDETVAIDGVTDALAGKSAAEVQSAIQDTRATIAALESATIKQVNSLSNGELFKTDKVGQAWVGADAQGKDEAGKIQAMIDAYKEYIEIRDEALKDGIVSDEERAAYDDANYFIDKYSETLGQIIDQREIIADLTEQEMNILTGSGADMTVDEIADALGLTAENAEGATENVDGLTEAIDGATAALNRYKAATEGELDDNFKSYADAWWKAWEDIEAGRTNSNAVNAAADLLLSDKQRIALYSQGMSVADELKKPFWQSVFAYVDEEGALQSTKGEDAGSLLGWYLFENFADEANNIVDKYGKVVASFEQIDDELDIDVDDFEALSNALSELYGTDVSPEFLEASFEAMGVFANTASFTAEMATSLAESLGALDKKGRINVDLLVSQALENGWTKKQVDDLLASLDLLEQKEQVELVFNPEGIDSASQKAEQLAEKKHEVTIEDNSEDVTDDLEEITYAVKGVTNDGTPWAIEFTVNKDEAISKIQEIHAVAQKAGIMINEIGQVKKSANGQRNFEGGLSLINEEAPELIVENGTARIAGNGMPTLTYLQRGADVYTAEETRAILGGSYPSQLFDGINAYKNGATVTDVTRWTPTNGTTTTSNTASTTTSGTDYSGGTGTEGTASTGSEKDEQLEALKNRIALLKSELDLMEERGDSLADQIKKQREIQGAYQDEINYLVSIGGDQTEINKLTTDWYKIENDIKKLQDEQIKEKQEKQIDLYEDKIALAKSELSLLEAQNKPVRQQIEKQRQISKLLLQQANYLKKIGGSQTDINKLLKERKDVEKDIAKLNEGLMDDLSDAVNNKIKKLNATRDKYVDSIQKQIDALKEKKDAQDAANESEEKHQALVEAWRNLKNAQKERTVRQYNAKTGQWEWVADASAVASAKEAYTSAKQDWKDYKANQSYEAKIAKLEAKQDKYTELFATKTDQWNKILEELADPVISISKALKNIENNATKDMKGDINALNKILKPLGYSISTKKLYDEGGILTGLGGIKATTRDETVLPPDITEKLLKPLHPAGFRQRMEELRYLYGANGSTMIGSNSNSIGSQHNGDLYTFGNVTLTETQARQTTMYDFVQAAKGLRSYSGRM